MKEEEFDKKVEQIGWEYASKQRDDFLGEVCYVLHKRSSALEAMFKLVRRPGRGGLATRYFQREDS